MAAPTTASPACLYRLVIENVIAASKSFFEEEGVDPKMLEQLQKVCIYFLNNNQTYHCIFIPSLWCFYFISLGLGGEAAVSNERNREQNTRTRGSIHSNTNTSGTFSTWSQNEKERCKKNINLICTASSEIPPPHFSIAHHLSSHQRHSSGLWSYWSSTTIHGTMKKMDFFSLELLIPLSIATSCRLVASIKASASTITKGSRKEGSQQKRGCILFLNSFFFPAVIAWKKKQGRRWRRRRRRWCMGTFWVKCS